MMFDNDSAYAALASNFPAFVHNASLQGGNKASNHRMNPEDYESESFKSPLGFKGI